MNITLILPILITVFGSYLLFKLRFFFIMHPIKSAKCFASAISDRETRRSFCLALAGTLGVGNIFGVAAAIMIGGPGSVFWLVLSSFFSMIIKYAETSMVCENVSSGGGMSEALKKIFKKSGNKLSAIYALFTVILALFMGAAMQTSALLDVAENTVGLNALIGGFISLILFLPCLIFGAKKIENITEILIPLTTILYIIACFVVILMNFSSLLPTCFMIIKSALSPRAITTGAFFIAIKEGFARGMLSNEAGIGTSALAHSKIKHKDSATAGILGMCEVLFDTTLLCTLTAMAILVSVNDINAFSTPMSLVYTAFTSTLGKPFGYILLAMVFAFAYSTVICWYYYGYKCICLHFAPLLPLYMIVFPTMILFSSLIKVENLLYLTDTTMLIMAFITIFSIIKSINKIKSP